MAAEGDVVEFVGTSPTNRFWKCMLGESVHRHENRVRVKLGQRNGWRYVESECLEHPNHRGSVAHNRAMTVIIRQPKDALAE